MDPWRYRTGWGVPYDQVLRYKHRDGSTVWLRSRGHVLRGADGSPTRMIGVHQDLTEVIRNERRTHSLLDSFPGGPGVQKSPKIGQECPEQGLR